MCRFEIQIKLRAQKFSPRESAAERPAAGTAAATGTLSLDGITSIETLVRCAGCRPAAH